MSHQHGHWPALIRVRPQVVVTNVATVVLAAWAAMIAVDVLEIAGPQPTPLWVLLFNDGLIEWLQWFLLPTGVFASGFLVSRLLESGDRGAANFFLFFGIGLALMLVEDAGDIRHAIRSLVHLSIGDRIFGVQTGLVVEVPYFLLLAAVPLYALARFGRHIWQDRRTRRYLIAGYGLYAVAAGASAFRILGNFYIVIGRWVDNSLFGGRFAIPQGRTQEYAHFYLVDGPIEESIELIAAACLLGVTLAFSSQVRGNLRTAGPDDDCMETT
jgi:hypothetical protein